jgi:hypothetical protein
MKTEAAFIFLNLLNSSLSSLRVCLNRFYRPMPRLSATDIRDQSWEGTYEALGTNMLKN